MTSDRNIDYSRIRTSVDKMIDAGKPPEFIKGFLEYEGATVEGLRDYSRSGVAPAPSEPSIQVGGSDVGMTSAGAIDDNKTDMEEMAPNVAKSVAAEQRPSFPEKIGQAWDQRRGKVRDVKERRKSGELGPITALSTPIGQAAGFGLDVVSGAMGSAYRGLTPDPVERKVEQLGSMVAESPVGKATGAVTGAAQKGFEKLEEAAPTGGRVLRDVANIGMLAGPVKSKGGAVSKGRTGQLADIVATGKRRDSGIRELVRPTGKKAEEAMVDYTEVKGVGPFKRKEVSSSDFLKGVEDEVINIPGVSPRKSIQENYNTIQGVVNTDRAAIESALDASQSIIPRGEVLAKTKKATDKALSNPIFKGEISAAKAGQAMVDEFNKILEKHPGTARGMHDARVEYDKWVTKFNPNITNYETASNVKKIVNKAIRDELNDTVDRIAPDIGYKAYREKSSNLLTAMGNMRPKARKEVLGMTKTIQDILKPSGIPYIAPSVKAGVKLSKAALVGTLDAIDVGLRTIKDPRKLAELRAYQGAINAYIADEEKEAEAP